MVVQITRRQVYRSRFATGPGPAWKWLYDVTTSDGRTIVYGTDRLAIAERLAKQHATTSSARVVRAWELSS